MIDFTYRPARFSKSEMEEFREFRKKAGHDFRFCQNNRKFRTKNRTMRRVMVGFTVDDIFLLFNVEYGWHSLPQDKNGHIEIVSTELLEVNEEEASEEDRVKYKNSFRDNEEFKKSLVEADYFRYEPSNKKENKKAS